ncbi:PIN domain-containing protein [Candidatus Symbiothrix dinenymphae]|uniref:PIN domain-containing protein n=1 Tax=Candidatus Symbiothrix dinenymphae TaxID=467085 RepID=UPI00131547AF|nr:PIN domain-containing protein [Candidatus Symbiothrix dinenymphae]
MKSTVYLDTNIILRLFLNDDEVQKNTSILTLESNNCFVFSEVLSEVVYVLLKTYESDRHYVASSLRYFLRIPTVSVIDFEVIDEALKVFATTKLDFVDCMLSAYSKVRNFEIATYDRALISQMARK